MSGHPGGPGDILSAFRSKIADIFHVEKRFSLLFFASSYAFIKEDTIKLKIDDQDLYKSFKEFYSHGSNAVDLLRDKNSQNYKQWSKEQYVKLARKNPVHFLCQSESDFFSKDETHMYLTEELAPYLNNPLFIEHLKDAIELRKQEFYKNRLEKLKE